MPRKPRRASDTSSSSPRSSSGGGFWRWVRRWMIRGAILGLLIAGAVAYIYSSLARRFNLADLGKMPERSIVYDAQGQEIGRLHGQNRIVVPLGQISPHFIDALLAREDDRFYKHGGIDWIGLARAVVRNLKDRDATQGASTITMQVARNSFGLSAKSIHRKLLEAALAKRIEKEYSKDQILEFYINRIFFGSGLYGVERASQAYFGKKSADVTLDESAMLAAIIRGPNKFSPFRHYDIALSGKNMVLDRMVVKGRLDQAKADEAKKVNTKVLPEPDATAQETWALDAVRRDLNVLLDDENEEDGGLRIYTTLDVELQAALEKSIESNLATVEKTQGYAHETRAQYLKKLEGLANGAAPPAPHYLQGAAVIVENLSGALRAVVGGRDYHHSPYNRALLSTRQVGSTFKPFVYAAAIQNGLTPATMVDDGPVNVRGWQPHNSDGTYQGFQPAEFGLYKSRNTMTARVGEIAQLDHVIELAERAGLGPIKDKKSPQLYIGNTGTTLRALTSAYSIFPAGGQRFTPYLIEKIETVDGEVVFAREPNSYVVMTPGASWCVTTMMEKVMGPSGTGAHARSLGFKSPAAGKTGTTDDYKDAWFVGFNHRLTCGVWVGMDQPERIVYQGYGSRLALPIWVDAMKTAEKLGCPPESPRPEVETEKVTLCTASGRLASRACEQAGATVTTEYPVDLLRSDTCSVHGGRSTHTRSRGRSAPSGEGFLSRMKRWFGG